MPNTIIFNERVYILKSTPKTIMLEDSNKKIEEVENESIYPIMSLGMNFENSIILFITLKTKLSNLFKGKKDLNDNRLINRIISEVIQDLLIEGKSYEEIKKGIERLEEISLIESDKLPDIKRVIENISKKIIKSIEDGTNQQEKIILTKNQK